VKSVLAVTRKGRLSHPQGRLFAVSLRGKVNSNGKHAAPLVCWNTNSGPRNVLTQKPNAARPCRAGSKAAQPAGRPSGRPRVNRGRRSAERLRGVGTLCETLPVPGSVGAGPSLLGPPLIQGCLLSLAQITEAGRTHELQPAKSPHGQMCVCAWQLQIHHPVYTHTRAAGAAAAAAAAVT